MGFSEHTDTIFNGTGLHQITETGESKQDTGSYRNNYSHVTADTATVQ